MKRILDCTSKEFKEYTPNQLKQAIKAGEGRTICSEMIVTRQCVGGNITHAEVARAFGADLILLNDFDCFDPKVHGLSDTVQDKCIIELKKLVGRPIGINLEPIDLHEQLMENRIEISKGRVASIETLQKANELEIDFLCFTGNPATGVTNNQIIKAIQLAKKYFNGLIIAGKMHSSGSSEPVCTVRIAQEFIQAGADIILVPAVGTVPGFTDTELQQIVKIAHDSDTLVLSSIGTSQESSSQSVIEQIAIRNKIAGVDIHHIGDGGYGGLALVENIMTLSIAIRGMRHTINRMATSVNRK